jgi:hypothetical protein
MEVFSEDVLRPLSLYTDMQHINYWRSKMPISATGNEEDVLITPCLGEKVCIQRPKGVADKMYHVYLAVLEEFGVKIPFTPFEVDVLSFLNVAPSHIQPNSWGIHSWLQNSLQRFGIGALRWGFLSFLWHQRGG